MGPRPVRVSNDFEKWLKEQYLRTGLRPSVITQILVLNYKTHQMNIELEVTGRKKKRYVAKISGGRNGNGNADLAEIDFFNL